MRTLLCHCGIAVNKKQMANIGVSAPYVQCPLNFEADIWPCDNFLQSTGGLRTYCSTLACRDIPIDVF